MIYFVSVILCDLISARYPNECYHLAISGCYHSFFACINDSVLLHVRSEVVLNKDGKRIGRGPREDRLISIRPNSFRERDFKYQRGGQPEYLQFIVQDETHEDQHSVVLCVDDNRVLAKRMRYKEICEPFEYTEWI